ncbi:hypothetical protein ACJMK2_024552 [Sinanodonta woodiana]|uniref:SEA domain-containing protein n=1 Tax=Sinanodonta woodiana TaxID=1069815 RepID=A0ABD3XHM4_SINWO
MVNESLIRGSTQLGRRFLGLSIVRFSQGSVIVNFTALFSDEPNYPINSSILITVLKDGLTNRSISGNYSVNPDSIKVDVLTTTTTLPSSSTRSPQNDELPNWGIAVIVCGGVVLIFLIALICALCQRRHARHKYALTEDPDDIGYRRSWSSSEINDYTYDNKMIHEGSHAETREVKQPVAFYNLTNRDLNGDQDAADDVLPNQSTDNNKTTSL